MKKDKLDKNKEREVAVKRYRDVMKCIIRRYVTAEQKKTEEFSITEDDVSEIRQDINKFRSVFYTNFMIKAYPKNLNFVSGTN